MNNRHRSSQNFERILILKWGAVGDLIAGTVAIGALREQYPSARITLLTNTSGGQICPAGSIVDHVLDRRAYPGAKGWFALLRRLRREHFDLAVNLKWGSEGAALLTRLSAPVTAGGGTSLWRFLYRHRAATCNVWESRHEYHKNLDIVEAAGVAAVRPRAYLHLNAEDRAFAATFFAAAGLDGGPILVISPGASRPGKRWHWARFAEVGRRFVEAASGSVVVTWAPKEEPLARDVAAAIGAGAHLSPPTNIRQVAAITERSDLCLCNNSGMLHVAYAMKKPVLCINSSVTWAPYGDLAIAVNGFSEENLRRYPHLRAKGVARTREQIDVDEVWGALYTRTLPLCRRYEQRIAADGEMVQERS